MTERVQKAICWVEEHSDDAPTWGGVFDTRNIAGDRMHSIYGKDGITIDACYDYGYIEVFGLTDEEFDEFREAVEVDPMAEFDGEENEDDDVDYSVS